MTTPKTYTKNQMASALDDLLQEYLSTCMNPYCQVPMDCDLVNRIEAILSTTDTEGRKDE